MITGPVIPILIPNPQGLILILIPGFSKVHDSNSSLANTMIPIPILIPVTLNPTPIPVTVTMITIQSLGFPIMCP